ncbi:MAG: organic solvent tolerance protein OstA, partial [Pirellulales bacterium]|nr:organic solvent tolerance protein OstA [Pirellulales bacterium]
MIASGQQTSPDPIAVSGDSIYRWQMGDADASLLEGDCVIQQGTRRYAADSILLVVDGAIGSVRNRLVIEGMRTPGGAPVDQPRVFTLETLDEPKILSPRYRGQPRQTPRLLGYLPDTHAIPSGTLSLIRPIQFEQPASPQSVSPQPGLELQPPGTTTFPDGATTGGWKFIVGGGTRSIEILARGTSRPPQVQTINRPENNETVVAARGGVTILIHDVTAQLPSGQQLDLGTVSLSADRVVGWLPLLSGVFSGTTDFSQAQGELYLEGDIVFRAGERIIYAESMYYNVAQEVGVVLDAEAITTVEELQGIVRLKADVLQQLARGDFIAFDAAVTSSRMGVPRYWLQSERLKLTDRQVVTPDPATGVNTLKRDPYVSSSNNFVYFGGVPLLYWPTFSTSLRRPTFYVSGADINNDNNFGTQVLLDFDVFQLLGIDNAPRGVDWELSVDYLSSRGPAAGTNLNYQVPFLFGFPGPVNGYFDAWLIDDRGLDTLGLDRIDLPPETTTRGRALLRHRHFLPNDYELMLELGWISDRNFLEQFLENEWDQQLDHRTALRLRKYHFSHLFDLSAQVQVNDFFTEEERLPRLDHYLLGGSILGDWLTWSAHNRVGYERLNVADVPDNPAEAAEQSAIPGEANQSGIVASSRQEIAMPINLGPVKLVPNVSGEVAHYGEAADGDSLTRLLGQAGVRASLQMWRVDPTIESSLLNMRGLAHKLEWTAEYFYADSDTNLAELPLYDPLDDNAQEQFRRRFIQDTFGGALPLPFDPRTYAFRHGFQGLVASPNDVIADDLQQFRIGLNQRFQTKRGLPGRERIVDLLQIDMDLLLFPEANRDNFGE